jgi:NAD(P)-dependent dehydrogenase (short-subunit alcohol dehydrogenase family)
MDDSTADPLGRTILITGASSGLGAALALACAKQGRVLHLGGRDAARLDVVAAACRAKGARVVERILDVRDAAGMEAWIAGTGRLDLVIANAALGGGSDDGRPEPSAQVRTLFAVNLDGALNTALPALDVMLAQSPGAGGVRGRIVVIASVAAFVPGPGAATYCAAKAALDRWTIATAHTAGTHGVVMTSVCPGYVRTPMTAGNRFPMPGLMDADRAASIILAGIVKGRRRVAFPWWMAAAARLVGALPPRWSTALLAKPPGNAPRTS